MRRFFHIYRSWLQEWDWCPGCGREFRNRITKPFIALWNTLLNYWPNPLIYWIKPVQWFHNTIVCSRWWPGRIYRDWHVEKCVEKNGFPREDGEHYFTTKLKAEIICAGLTDLELAREFGVSIPTVRRWRNGDSKPHRIMQAIVLDWFQKRRHENP